MGMNKPVLRIPGLWIVLAIVGLLVPTGALFAQMSDNEAGAAGLAVLGGMLFVFLIIFGVFYVYISLALSTIAKKTNTENPWMAWIPIVNIILMLNIAKKPMWWILLCLIPVVSIVIMILVWMEIAKARNKPEWWGILLIVPVVNIIVPGYLAWSD
jgi:cytochrome bd-type quinol oxidase subunit 2